MFLEDNNRKESFFAMIINFFKRIFGLAEEQKKYKFCAEDFFSKIENEFESYQKQFKEFEFKEFIQSTLQKINEKKVQTLKPILFYMNMPVWFSLVLNKNSQRGVTSDISLSEMLMNHIFSLNGQSLNQQPRFAEDKYWKIKSGQFDEFGENLTNLYKIVFDEKTSDSKIHKMQNSIDFKVKNLFGLFQKLEKEVSDEIVDNSMIYLKILVKRIVKIALNSNLNKEFMFLSSSGKINLKKINTILLLIGQIVPMRINSVPVPLKVFSFTNPNLI